MWAPGAYNAQGRVTLPAPNIGIEKYFFDVAETILSHIKSSRNTVILPQRTGPIADVLYSAAGNSADDQYYRKGIIAYSFEAGAQRISVNPTTGAITRTDVGFQPCFGGPGTGGRARVRHGRNAERAAGQRGPRLDDGVRRGQLRPAPGRAGVLAGRHRRRRRRSSTRPRRPAASRSTSGSTGSASRRSSTTRPTARRRRLARRPTTTQGPRRPGEVLTLAALGAHDVKWFVGRHQGQPSRRSRRSACWSRPTTRTAPSAARCRRRWRSRWARRRRSARSRRASRRTTRRRTTANVISTAGDATLSVADPSSTNTGQAGQRRVRAGAVQASRPAWAARRAAVRLAPTSNEADRAVTSQADHRRTEPCAPAPTQDAHVHADTTTP